MNKRIQLSQNKKDLLWNRYYGLNTERVCFSCKYNIINKKNCHYGHIQSLKCGGSNDITNFIPICQECNLDMAEKNIYQYMAEKFYDRMSIQYDFPELKYYQIWVEENGNVVFSLCKNCGGNLGVFNSYLVKFSNGDDKSDEKTHFICLDCIRLISKQIMWKRGEYIPKFIDEQNKNDGYQSDTQQYLLCKKKKTETTQELQKDSSKEELNQHITNQKNIEKLLTGQDEETKEENTMKNGSILLREFTIEQEQKQIERNIEEVLESTKQEQIQKINQIQELIQSTQTDNNLGQFQQDLIDSVYMKEVVIGDEKSRRPTLGDNMTQSQLKKRDDFEEKEIVQKLENEIVQSKFDNQEQIINIDLHEQNEGDDIILQQIKLEEQRKKDKIKKQKQKRKCCGCF